MIKKGYKRTKKHSKKISKSLTGKKRKPFTEEHKRRIGLVAKGRKHSEESKRKMSECRKGGKAYQWRGGISRGYKTGYYSREYKEWREKVFRRDKYLCQQCFMGKGQYITAHHIKSFAHYPELRFDIKNGLTLCEECHKETDNYKGRNKGKTKQ